MSADFNIKPVGASVAATYIEPASDAAKTAVPTQLPPDKAVTAPDASLQSRFNPQAETDRVSRQVVIDRAAAEIVYRTVDKRTSIVVTQYPDEARLRARAYLRALDMARQDNALQKTDLSI
ncbi:hypothetical protein [Bradyrhizobium sp. G127]|uniref:hypothetical protein n=1 Tax=Bradyrhizobium sp. G127 TaxID=2904800 RepID=UPI001F457924|nr:hypothetical protein [Bradyrhizobium sp. G127]MCF2524383.1 hypothetical protein [Bradyrhizobium sp. G127]